MSKIQEMIHEINRYLDSDDRTSTASLRKCASEYANAVHQLSEELNECRSLIAQGLVLDAKKINNTMHPTLSERGRMLNFPRFPEWKETCIKYNLPVPEDLDIATISALEEQNPVDQEFSKLVLDWRKNAREGDPLSKIHILREILKKLPAGTDQKVWINNLVNVEKKLIPWLIEKINQAFENNEFEKANSLFTELMSSEMKTRPESVLTAPIAEKLSGWQKKQVRQKAESMLEQMDSAYAEQNRDRLQKMMRSWDVFAENPLLELTENEEIRIHDAKRWLEICENTDRKEAQIRTTTQKLEKLLDESAPFPEIKQIHNELLRLTDNIDQAIEAQVQNLQETFSVQEKRKHIRHCIYGFIAMFLLILGTGFAIVLFQQEREYSITIVKMQDFLKKGNTAALDQFYEDLQKKDQRLAQRAEIQALSMKSKALKDKIAADSAEFDRLNLNFKNGLNPKNIEMKEMKVWLNQLQKMKEFRSQEQLDSFERNYRTYITMQEERKRLDQEAFLKKCADFKAKQMELWNQLKNPKSDLSGFRHNMDMAEQVILMLDKNEIRVESALKRREIDKLRMEHKKLIAEGKQEIRKRAIRSDLLKPQSALVYQTALKQMPSELPEELDLWKDAVKTLPFWEQINSLAITEELLNDPQKLADMKNLSENIPDSPYALDLAKLKNPGKQTAEIQKIITDTLEKRFMKESDLYEFIFWGLDQKKYIFYTEKQPDLRQRPRGVIRTISMELVLHPNENTQPFDLNALWDKNTVRYQTGSLERKTFKGMPEIFIGLSGMNPAKGTFEKARHHRFLAEAIPLLKNAVRSSKTAVKEAENLFNKLKKTPMNPYMQRVIGLQLLKIIQIAEPDANLNPEITMLRESVNASRHWNWRNPTESADHPGELQLIQTALDRIDPAKNLNNNSAKEQLLRTALTRRLEPAAVVYLKPETGKAVCYPLLQTLPQELWVFSFGSKLNGSVYALSPENFTKGFPADFRKEYYLFNGQLLFTPSDFRRTEDVLKDVLSGHDPKKLSSSIWPQLWPVNKRGF